MESGKLDFLGVYLLTSCCRWGGALRYLDRAAMLLSVDSLSKVVQGASRQTSFFFIVHLGLPHGCQMAIVGLSAIS